MADNCKFQRSNVCKMVPTFSNVNGATCMDPLSTTRSNMQLFACKNRLCSRVFLSLCPWDNNTQQLDDKPEELESSILLPIPDPMGFGHFLGTRPSCCPVP
ncbi:hypothetical protein EJD97_002862 [Solanum chilense]|uniref:Uncharacterized protein n=1 Tax=Solanum chilense TaxID=4083 RepID=A0A6N2C272_SOLCI|nr:hypothetical protein EJD97_002862 [Solanum chilense]